MFGPKDQIKSFGEKISLDDYYLFWGDYSVKEKYASKFASTSDWAVYFKSDCNKLPKVSVSRAYLKEKNSKSEVLR